MIPVLDRAYELEPIAPGGSRSDADEWDRLVLASSGAYVYHTWAWYEALREGLREIPLRWWICRGRDVAGVVAVGRRGVRSGRIGGGFVGRHVYRCWSPTPRTWGYGGPCLSASRDDVLPARIAHALAASLGRRIGCAGTRFAFPDPDGTIAATGGRLGARVQRWPTGILSLKRPEEALLQSLTKGVRYNIKRATKVGSEVREVASEADVRGFAEGPWRHLQNRLRSESPSPYSPVYLGIDYFRALWHHLGRERCLFLLSFQDGRNTGGVVCTRLGTRATYQHAAAFVEQGTSPNALLLWEAIRRLREAGVERFDLAGVPTDPRDGVGLFKRSWHPAPSALTWLYFGRKVAPNPQNWAPQVPPPTSQGRQVA